MIPGATWAHYEAMDELFARLGCGIRVRFLHDALEIQAPGPTGDDARESLLRRLVEIYCTSGRIRYFVRGPLALQVAGVAGGRPAESFSFWEKGAVPDLVIDVALSPGGLSKRLFWQALAVPEYWLWQRHALEVFVWDAEEGRHQPSQESRMLPGLDLRLLAECARLHNAKEALSLFGTRLGIS